MVDKVKFMETLQSVAEIAKVSPEPLTKKEIEQYFIDMDLSDEQLAMVYQYLLKAESEEDTETGDNESQDTESQDYTETTLTEDGYVAYDGEEKPQKAEVSAFLQMYLDDIASIERLDEAAEDNAYLQLLQGNDSVIARISDHWLAPIVTMARTYEKRKVNLEDLIQEGNIGLILGMNELLGSEREVNVKEFLESSVKGAMERYIDEMISDDDWTNSMIAKATLINEAKKAFAEEHVQIPTVKELADYTKISEEEIIDILNLSLDKVKEENTDSVPADRKTSENADTLDTTDTAYDAYDADTADNAELGDSDQLGTVKPWSDMKFE